MSVTDTFEEIDPQLLEALGRTVPCDHSQLLPLYKVGDRWCCIRCVDDARVELDAEERTWAIRRAFPLTYAPELVEKARGYPLTPSEHGQLRAHPSRWLRKYGLGDLLG